MSILSDNLKRFRKANNYTQAGISEKTKISRSTYAHYESGDREPDYETLLILAEQYNTTPSQLLGFNTGEAIAIKDLEEILINDDLTLKLGEHTISKEDRKTILDILKTYYKSTK